MKAHCLAYNSFNPDWLPESPRDVDIALTERAEALSDRVGIMRGGKLLALGTAEELKALAGKEKFEDAFVAIVKGEGK